MERNLRQEFIDNALFRMDESQRMIEKCLTELRDDDLWKRPNTVSNSIGNQLRHLEGNITQYAIAGLRGTADQRDRESEFSSTSGPGKEALLRQFRDVLLEAKSSIRQLTDAQLVQVREVQGFRLSGLGIVLHVVEHLSYHTGQIAFWTKLLTGRKLGFYDGIDLNKKNN